MGSNYCLWVSANWIGLLTEAPCGRSTSYPVVGVRVDAHYIHIKECNKILDGLLWFKMCVSAYNKKEALSANITIVPSFVVVCQRMTGNFQLHNSASSCFSPHHRCENQKIFCCHKNILYSYILFIFKLILENKCFLWKK